MLAIGLLSFFVSACLRTTVGLQRGSIYRSPRPRLSLQTRIRTSRYVERGARPLPLTRGKRITIQRMVAVPRRSGPRALTLAVSPRLPCTRSTDRVHNGQFLTPLRIPCLRQPRPSRKAHLPGSPPSRSNVSTIPHVRKVRIIGKGGDHRATGRGDGGGIANRRVHRGADGVHGVVPVTGRGLDAGELGVTHDPEGDARLLGRLKGFVCAQSSASSLLH